MKKIIAIIIVASLMTEACTAFAKEFAGLNINIGQEPNVVCIPSDTYCGHGDRKDSCKEFNPNETYPEKAVYGQDCNEIECNLECPVYL